MDSLFEKSSGDSCYSKHSHWKQYRNEGEDYRPLYCVTIQANARNGESMELLNSLNDVCGLIRSDPRTCTLYRVWVERIEERIQNCRTLLVQATIDGRQVKMKAAVAPTD